jgi:LmbE family N-acetylglucosaminyl deacetylase
LRIIAFGAHPDDAEIRMGGTAMLWSDLGHAVQIVAVTNGDLGHTRIHGPELAAKRLAEVQEVAKVFHTTARVMDNPDGELMPTLENRRAITRLIREWEADLVISHRPNDYHPDHRSVGVLAQDAAFMVTVPFYCPETPPLAVNPVFLFLNDDFQQPHPFRADIVVAIDSVLERKLDGMLKLESVFIENTCIGPYPKDEAQRAAFGKAARGRLRNWFGCVADCYRDELIECYGEEQGRQVRYAEAFEICEYGRQPTTAELKRLFPFVPADRRQKMGQAEEKKPRPLSILALWDPSPEE